MLAAIGFAVMILGGLNQTAGLSNGATLLCFIGFGILAAAVIKGGRRVHH